MKLYRFADERKEYWETWDDGKGIHTVHWGQLGSRGETKTVKSTLLRKAESTIQKDVDRLMDDGFRPVEPEAHATLMVEYAIHGMGTPADLDKRHRLEERINETLGWTGLGACDGGSIGSGTMEVCNFVVDFQVAKAVIEKDLVGTEFANYTRIYDGDATDG